MDFDEKLKYFYDTTMSTISRQGDEEISALKKKLDADFESYKKKTQEEVKLHESMHLEDIKRKARQRISNEKLIERHRLSEERERLKGLLFDEVAGILEEYRKSPEYTETLVGQINKARKFANGYGCEIYISPDDAHLKDELEQRTGEKLLVAKTPTGGGIQAEIPSRNIFIDESFSSKYNEARAAYVVTA